MADSLELLRAAYLFFNARDLDAALKTMHEDVEWPNGMEGGWVHGHAGVREYWTRQWGMIDPRVEPVEFETEPDGRIAVTVHQVVRELNGNLLMDRLVEHVYRVEDGLIRRMEIREPVAK
jgi:ketosteroid isomerase-like protein